MWGGRGQGGAVHYHGVSLQSRKEEALRKRRNIPVDSEDYQASLGPNFTLESLVIKAQSANPDEQFSAVQAAR